MAKTKPVRMRISPKGDTVTITLAQKRLEELLAHLPEGDLRDSLVNAGDESERRRNTIAKEDRLRAVLSPESLALAKWEVIGTPGKDVFTAIRHGDMRLALVDGRYGWEVGPAGAFDRDDDGRQPVRGHFQVGVFCPGHRAYLLTDPIADHDEAMSSAARLRSEWEEWHAKAPRMTWGRRPYDYQSMRGMLPPGARHQTQVPPVAMSALSEARHDDLVVYGTRDSRYASTYACEAVLLPYQRFDRECGKALIAGTRWAVGRRTDRLQGKYRLDHRPMDGPYDYVMGSVWVGLVMPWTEEIGEVVGMTSREEAIERTRQLAIEAGITAAEQKDMAA